MRKEARSFRAQATNKYGVLGATVLATLMFIMVPVWGFAKSYKHWEPIMRVLEKLPYVTWLIDWMGAYCAGETDTSSIPTTVRDFADGKETPITAGGLFNQCYPVSDGSAHRSSMHDDKACEARHILNQEKDCGNSCFCTCHCGEEAKDIQEDIAEDGGIPESRGGLGSKEANSVKSRHDAVQKSMFEDKESRVARLLNPVRFIPAQQAVKEEKGKEKETPVECSLSQAIVLDEALAESELHWATEVSDEEKSQKEIDLVPELAEVEDEKAVRNCLSCKKPLHGMSVWHEKCKPKNAPGGGGSVVAYTIMKKESMLGITLEDYLQVKGQEIGLITGELWYVAKSKAVGAYGFVKDHAHWFALGLGAVMIAAMALKTVLEKSDVEEQWTLEGKPKSNKSKSRYVPPLVKTKKEHRRHDHVETGGAEVDSESERGHPEEEDRLVKSRRVFEQ